MVSFAEFSAEVQKIAEAERLTDPGVPFCDPWDRHFRGAFDKGWTPREAFDAEIKARNEGDIDDYGETDADDVEAPVAADAP